MSLVEEFPYAVKIALRKLKVPMNGELSIAVESDIGPDGNFGEQWLIATDDRVLVLHRRKWDVEVKHDVPMAEIKSAAAETMVGSGVLRVHANGEPCELLRYTNSRAKQFTKAARKLQTVVSKDGEKFHEHEEEETACPSCNRPLPPDTKVCPQCINRGKTMLRLLRYAAPYWKQLVLVIFLYMLGHAGEYVPAYLMKHLIDDVFNAGNHGLFAAILAGLVAVQLARTGLGWGMSRIFPWVAAVLTRDIRQALYQAFQRLGVSYFDKKQVGALMTRLTQDTQSLNNLLTDALPEALWVFGMLIITPILLLAMNWKLALVSMIPAPMIVFTAGWFFRRLLPNFRRMWARWSRFGAVVNDSLSGIRVVKAFAQEGREIDRFRERNDAVFETGVRIDRYFWMMWPTMELLTGLGTLIVWGFGGRQLLGGEMTLGTLFFFITVLGMFYYPFRWVGRLCEWISRSLTACERIFEVLDTKAEVYESSETVRLPHVEGRVTFDNVTFGYDPNKPVLKKINLDVAPGEMIGLVGPSGAGKSTTVSLICRFYTVQEGSLSIDGVDIRKIHLHDLRKQIGIVLQEPFLFSGTILENIGYAKPDATREEIMEAAKAANAHDFIVRFPDGYDTQVGERGGRLSGGERQRVSIARAILHNPRILILDEATASVDTQTEKKIQDALARLVSGRTTFAIAHRLSTLRNATRLIVLDKGEQKELGTHDELLQADGLYANLVKMQSEINQMRAVDG